MTARNVKCIMTEKISVAYPTFCHPSTVHLDINNYSMKKLIGVLAVTGFIIFIQSSCTKESMQEKMKEKGLAYDRDSIPTDSIPHDTIPYDSIPHDTIPHDTIPHDSIPHPPHDTFPYPPHDTFPHIPNPPHDTFPSYPPYPPYPPHDTFPSYPNPPQPPYDTFPHHDTGLRKRSR